ncbi:hypothetical protein NBO_73g0023 [Nosema bombycis CQ1]|uniref:Uncharacterized protein n=1 Tax=Nosema bombycis (strain CQ1 / CVCC 102059) TaxID=578461 RepID=R0KTA6_NOSB1|nr:hypothetical protein NBO_73g0023 [Nosema bombycis CQ1]|eukprot:EOB13457.1 hypothetical protein NBO_73g0023 [Nosema bombycis CQ1]
MLQRFNDFLDLFRNNLLIEYNRNPLLKSKLIPISKYYTLACTGDRIFLKYLNKLKYFNNSKTTIPQYYGGIRKNNKVGFNKDLNITTSLPLLPSFYNFNLKNYLNFIFLKFKNLFLDNKTLLKFKIEEEVIPKLNLKDIRNIEYLGKNEFVMEGEGEDGSNLQIKIKVKEEEGGVVIEKEEVIGLWVMMR